MGRASRKRKETSREERIKGREPNPPLTFRQFVDMCKGAAEASYLRIKDEESDPFPIALFETPRESLMVAGLDPNFMASTDRKDALAQVLAKLVKDRRARKIATQFASWYAEAEEGTERADLERDDFVPPSQRPDRIEICALTVYDEERVETWWAKIERSPDGAKLRPWNEHLDGKPILEMEGRFIEPIVEALR